MKQILEHYRNSGPSTLIVPILESVHDHVQFDLIRLSELSA